MKQTKQKYAEMEQLKKRNKKKRKIKVTLLQFEIHLFFK